MRPNERGRRSLAPWIVGAIALVLAACATAPSPSPAPSPDTEPSATAPCTASDLAAVAAGWEGAAGSRFTEVRVENRTGAPCGLTPVPVLTLVDVTGRPIAESRPRPSGRGPILAAGDTRALTVQLGNWCAQGAPPLVIRLELAGDGLLIDGLVTASTELPPCNAPGQPVILGATEWMLP